MELGLLAMLLNSNWKRLGDLAAGTLVVKTARTDLKLTGVSSKAEASALNISPQVFDYVAWIRPELVTENELRTIREYLARRWYPSEISPLSVGTDDSQSYHRKDGTAAVR